MTFRIRLVIGLLRPKNKKHNVQIIPVRAATLRHPRTKNKIDISISFFMVKVLDG